MDHILLNCLKLVARRYQNQYFGLVGAAVVSNKYDPVYETSIETISGKWKHAEHCAIEKFNRLYGDLPEDAIIVTTLSPCFVYMDDRYGISCSNIIDEAGIKTVYAGIEDASQLKYDDDHYKKEQFELIITDNRDIRYICKKLLEEIKRIQTI